MFFVIFITKLSQWNYGIKGRCYHTKGVAKPNASHPHDDLVYVSTSFAFMVIAFLIYALTASPVAPGYRMLKSAFTSIASAYRTIVDRTEGVALPDVTSPWRCRLKLFSTISMLVALISIVLLMYSLYAITCLSPYAQFVLHIYMAVTLRASNQAYLDETENEWGFGQVLAVILLFPLIAECGQQYVQYHCEL